MFPRQQGPVLPQHNPMMHQPPQGPVPPGHGAMGYPPQRPQTASMPQPWNGPAPGFGAQNQEFNAPNYPPQQGHLSRMSQRESEFPPAGFAGHNNEVDEQNYRPPTAPFAPIKEEEFSSSDDGWRSDPGARQGVINTRIGQGPDDLTTFIHEREQWPIRTSGYADIWKCALYWAGDIRRRERVAVKNLRIPVADKSQEEIERMVHRVRQEIHTWMRLPRHENVLPLYGVALGFGPLPSLVLPWMYNGTLTSYLERKPTLPYHKKLALILQVATGLRHLHANRIYHGDLTGSNVLINLNGDALISDFGLSSIMAEFNIMTHFRSCRPGALRWTDPALFHAVARYDGRHHRLSGETEDLRHDIYSMGCIILQVVTGLIPYFRENDLAVQMAKFSYQNPLIPPTIPRRLGNLMAWCWDRDRRIRPRLGEIVAAVQKEMGGPQVLRH
ncbi:kinase-like domain-containing protein [Scleroderma yunnanense]